jgi:hypothetical protein
VLQERCSIVLLGSGHVILIGASGAISGVLGIAAAAGNTRAYYWLVLQVVFAIFGSFAAISIAFTAHIGGFIAGVILTKFFVGIERKKRAKYLKPGTIIMIHGGKNSRPHKMIYPFFHLSIHCLAPAMPAHLLLQLGRVDNKIGG